MTTNYDPAAEQYARFDPPAIVTAQAHTEALAVLEKLTLIIEEYEWWERCNNLPKSGYCYNSGGEPSSTVRSDTPGEGRT